MLSATRDKATILFWHHINFGFLDNQAEKINWLRISVTHNRWQWLSSLTVPLSCGYCPRFGLHPQTLLFLCLVPSISSFQMPPLRVRFQTPGQLLLSHELEVQCAIQCATEPVLSHELNLLPILHNTNKTAIQLVIFQNKVKLSNSHSYLKCLNIFHKYCIWTLLLTMIATPFLLRDSYPQQQI